MCPKPPMLCIFKKGRAKLCTVIDGRKQNENTKKDVTPFPDQEQIRNDVARGKYQSKIDMSNAYEQIHVEPSNIWKMAFATIYGTFVSHTMQQGDCNAPATFQQLMTIIFREYIGRFVHVYLDDIFVFSNSIEEHEKHLRFVFDKLRKAQLFLEESKLDLYSKKMDCLGHIIDDRGIHADSDKMAQCATLSQTSAISSTFYARCIGIYRPIGCNPEEWSPIPMEATPPGVHG